MTSEEDVFASQCVPVCAPRAVYDLITHTDGSSVGSPCLTVDSYKHQCVFLMLENRCVKPGLERES